MKTIILISFFLVPISILAQTHPKFLRDSFHHSQFVHLPDGSVTIQENSSGSSYDENDSLIMERPSPLHRNFFEYFQDTTKITFEIFNNNSIWEPVEIVSKIYENGLLVKEWTQTKVNADWEDTKVKEHSYNNNKQLILYEEFAKPNGVWEVVVRNQITYNANNSFQDQVVWKWDTLSLNLMKTQRFKVNYDSNNKKLSTTEWRFEGADSNMVFHDAYHYDSNGKIDTTWHYDGNGNLTDLDVYEWFEPDSVIEYRITQSNGLWEVQSKRIDYLSDNTFGIFPDSLHFFHYKNVGNNKLARIKYEFNYYPISTSKLYLERIMKVSDSLSGPFDLRYIIKEWFHEKGSVGINNPGGPIGRLNFFPNPCSKGNPISLLNGNAIGIKSYEVYDQGGTIVQTGQNTSVIETSNLNRAGTYFVLAKYSNGELGAGIFMLH